jgi:hypothetical protein
VEAVERYIKNESTRLVTVLEKLEAPGGASHRGP